MTKAAAKALLAGHLAAYRKRPYSTLCALVEAPEDLAAEAQDGTRYTISVRGFWDGGKPGNLRVRGALGYNFLTSFLPLCEDFILAPDGSFVGDSTLTAS